MVKKYKSLIRVVGYILPPIASVALVLVVAPYLLPLTIQYHRDLPGSNDVSSKVSQGYGLQEVIDGVRRDLIAVQSRLIEDKEAAMFQVETFDIELSFTIKQSSGIGTEAGVPEFIVVSGTSNLAQEQIQKIKLHLRMEEPPDAKVNIFQTPIENQEQEIVIDVN